MKKLIFFSAAVMMLASCQNADKNEFTINGKLTNNSFEGKTVYLQEFGENWRDKTNIDSAIVKDGAFTFKGISKAEPILHSVAATADDKEMSTALVIEPGTIDVALDSVSVIGGTPNNTSYQEFASKMEGLEQEAKKIEDKKKATTDEAAIAELELQISNNEKEEKAALYSFTKSNIGTHIGTYLYANTAYSMSLEQLTELAAQVPEQYKENPKIKNIVEKRIPALEVTKIGDTFTNIVGKTLDGKDASLEKYAGKGKYVLVDFWASWCGPCRRDMPNLVKAYELYKDKGFEIVGVSLDSDIKDWAKGTEDLGITWPQFSDLKGWKSDASNAYGVASIPHTVLIDKDGKIIARGLHGKEVIAKLAELLK